MAIQFHPPNKIGRRKLKRLGAYSVLSDAPAKKRATCVSVAEIGAGAGAGAGFGGAGFTNIEICLAICSGSAT